MKNYSVVKALVIISLLFGTMSIWNNISADFNSNTSNSKLLRDVQNLQTEDHSDFRLNILAATDDISIILISPMNNSINQGGTTIEVEFQNSTGFIVEPITKIFRWDNTPNWQDCVVGIILPLDDGLHFLELEVESNSGLWSYASFSFYSDNEPFDVILNDLTNITSRQGGINIIHWETSYPSGTLNTLEVSDTHNDGDYDVFVGGTSQRVYSFDGRDGTPVGLSSVLGSEIRCIKNINNDSIAVGLSNGQIQILRNSDLTSSWSNSSEANQVIAIENDLLLENLITLNAKMLRSFNYTGSFNWNVTFNDSDLQTYLLISNVIGNDLNEIITINSSSHIKIFNSTDGSLITQFLTPTIIVSYTASFGQLLLGFNDGYVRSFNVSDGTQYWSKEIFTGTIIYDLSIHGDFVYGSTSNGILFKNNLTDGQTILSPDCSNSYIKQFHVVDFDQNSLDEVVVFTGENDIKNYDSSTMTNNWNFTSFGSLVVSSLVTDLDNNTYLDIVAFTGDGKVFSFNPRGTIPHGVPVWTNISFSFNDDICDNIPAYQYYSWDGNVNQSVPGQIPSPSGVHTLELWIGDNASNFMYQYYEFYSFLNLILNAPLNNSFVQSNVLVNLTFSETPLDVLYKWDTGDFFTTDPVIPVSESSHTLQVFITDNSFNQQIFLYSFITDNTPISTIHLVNPQNNSLVEGGEPIAITFSETPYLEFYSWNDAENETTLPNIPTPSDTHILRACVADHAMNWKTALYVFHTKIKIALTSHQNNTVIDPLADLVFEFGENPDIYEYSIDNGFFILFNDHSNTTTIPFVSVSGTHNLLMRVNDSFNGRWNEELYTFKVRIAVNLTSHSNGGFAETGDSLVISYSDPPATKLFSWDGNKNSSRDPIVPSPDGPHSLDIYVGNMKGDMWHYQYAFNVDTNLIDIVLTHPLDNIKINSWENITIDFSEPPHNLSYQWDNLTPSSVLSPFPSSNGVHQLNVTVQDQAGNTNSKVFSWIVDDFPIHASIFDFQSNHTYFSGDLLNVSFDETPLVTWFQWNHDVFYSPVLSPTPWGNATHLLNITSYDGLNWNTQLFNITTIDISPYVFVLDADKSYQSGSELVLNCSVDIVTSWHQWDNLSQIAGLEICTPERPISDGTHNLTLFVQDIGGSIALCSTQITIDNTPLTLVSSNPQNNSLVNCGNPITLEFSEVPFKVSYSWNNGARNSNLSDIPTRTGKNILNIKAFDQAGNLLDTNIVVRTPTHDEQVLQEFFKLLPPFFGVLGLLSVTAVAVEKKFGTFSSVYRKFNARLHPPKSH